MKRCYQLQSIIAYSSSLTCLSSVPTRCALWMIVVKTKVAGWPWTWTIRVGWTRLAPTEWSSPVATSTSARSHVHHRRVTLMCIAPPSLNSVAAVRRWTLTWLMIALMRRSFSVTIEPVCVWGNRTKGRRALISVTIFHTADMCLAWPDKMPSSSGNLSHLEWRVESKTW